MALLARMAGLKKIYKILFLTGAVFSYPFLLFSLVIEQYIFALFYLMALVYAFIHKKQNRDFYFIAAAGSLVTSAVLFPFLSYSKQFKVWFRDIFHCFLKFLAVLIVFGRFTEILNYSWAMSLVRFSGVGLAFKDRLLQYIHFISLCFFAPAGTEIHTEPHPSYQLAPVTGLHIPGLVLLAAALAGFVLNRKNTLARICAGWVLFSFVILCVIGWGAAENGLVLYTLYFSWAFLSLVVMAIEKLFAGLPPLKLFLYILGIVGLAAVNIPGIAKIIDFGIRYYG
jgi:hypothetical protein